VNLGTIVPTTGRASTDKANTNTLDTTTPANLQIDAHTDSQPTLQVADSGTAGTSTFATAIVRASTDTPTTDKANTNRTDSTTTSKDRPGNANIDVQPSPFNSPSTKKQGMKSPNNKKKNQKSPSKATTETNSSKATPTKNGNKRGVKQDTPEHTKESDRHAKKLAEK
jgi:hypothetical protein